MFKFQCHGSYLRDFDVRGDVLWIVDITNDEADAMLSASPYLVPTKTRDARHGLLLNKGFAVYIDRSVNHLRHICVSAGKRGLQLRLAPAELIKLTGARAIDVTTL